MICHPIGVFRTPYKQIADMPIQPAGAQGVYGHIELNPELTAGLKDLDGFSHVIVLYSFHQTPETHLQVVPFLDDRPHGVFATRAPCRPNPIGLSLLRLCKINRNVIELEGVDMLDNTPLLDIKPYVPNFDIPNGHIRSGWLRDAETNVKEARSDQRFVSESQGGDIE